MSFDPRDLHISLTVEHAERAFEIANHIQSCAVSAREAFYRGSHPLALHHVREVQIALNSLLPLAERLSNHVLDKGDAA